MSVGGTVAAGALEQVGVVITALDEFSTNMQKYQVQLNKVVESEGNAAAASQRARAATEQTTKAHGAAVAEMSRYALTGLILSGQMENLGIKSREAKEGMTLFFSAMSMGLSPTSVLLLALGTLAAVLVKAATYASTVKKEFAAVADITIKEAEATGIHTDQVRKAIEARKALILIEDAEIKSKILKLEATRAELGFMESIVRGYRMIVEVIKGKSIAEANAIVETEAMQARELKRLTTLAELNNTLAEHEKLLKSIAIAEAGGTEAIKAQEEHLKQLAEWEKLSADYAEAASRRKVKAWEEERKKRDDLIKQGRDADRQALEAAQAQEKAAYEERTRMRVEAAQAEQDAFKSRYQQIASFALAAAASIGNALGQAAQGANLAWRSVMANLVRMVAQAAAQMILAMAFVNGIFQGWGKAARLIAEAAVLTAMGEAAAAAIEQQGRSSSNASSPGAGRSGPNINVWSGSGGSGYQYNSGGSTAPSSVNVTIEQNITGDMSPENAKDWETNAQKFLDRNMPKWIARKRAVGMRFA